MASAKQKQTEANQGQNRVELELPHAPTAIRAITFVPFRRVIFTRAYSIIIVILSLGCFLDSPRRERNAPIDTPVQTAKRVE
jgi:hypothetical protein